MGNKSNRHEAALKSWRTRRTMSAFVKARAAEAASKEALRLYCEKHGWKLALFEARQAHRAPASLMRLHSGSLERMPI